MFNHVINEYRNVVRSVRNQIPNAVLAGGALRDTFYGKAVKDLDFVVAPEARGAFYPLSAESPWLRGIWPDKEFRYIDIPDLREYMQQEPNGAGIMDVIESTDKTVNFIIVEDIPRYTHHFPDSISQMVFDGETVHTSRQWHAGHVNNRVYYKENIKPERLSRLRQKYPEQMFMVEMAPNVFRQQEFPQPINLEELNF